MFFTHSGQVTYTSVMTTANLRRSMQLFFKSTIPARDLPGLRDAAVLGAISLSFALGAVIGGLTTPWLHDAGLCVPAALLFLALLDIFRRVLSGRSKFIFGTAYRPNGQVSRRNH
jgi:uncharacterized membrane protein YoaK (UPF0700 family)